jgi:MFS family permease
MALQDKENVPRDREQPGRFRYVVVIMAFIGNLILWGDRANIGVAAPAIADAYHWGPALMGSIFSAFTFGYWLTQIPGGRLGDYWPKRVSGWCAVWWSVFTALTVQGTTPTLMIAIRALVGIGEGPFPPTTTGLLSRWLPAHERGRAVALNVGASQLGPAILLPLAGWLVSSAGWQSVFWVFSIFGLVWAVAWYLLVTDRPEQNRRVTNAEARHIAASRGERTETLPMRAALRNRTTWGLILAYFGLPYTYFMVTLWAPSLLVNKFHVSIFHAGFLSALPPLLGFVACITGGTLVDVMIARGMPRGAAHKIIIGTGLMISATAMCMTTVNFTLTWVTTWLTVAVGGNGLALGVFWTLAVFISPRRASGISGAMNFAGITGAFISPLLTGWIVAVTDSYVWAFLIDGAILLVCLALLVGLVGRGDPVLSDEATGTAPGD